MKVRVKSTTPPKSPAPQPQAPPRKREDSFISRACKIVIEDIKAKFGVDAKSRENRMRYEEFMERFGK